MLLSSLLFGCGGAVANDSEITVDGAGGSAAPRDASSDSIRPASGGDAAFDSIRPASGGDAAPDRDEPTGQCSFAPWGCYLGAPCSGSGTMPQCDHGVWSCPDGYFGAELCDPPCVGMAYSTLAGVSIRFAAPQTCTFTLAEAAAGVRIQYFVDIPADVPNVMPSPQDAGRCGRPDASGLIVFEKLDGAGQAYCLCDTGLCPPYSAAPSTLHAASYPAEFSWTGRNWSGPSDTMNPLGEPFPAGRYTLHVTAMGAVASSVDGGAATPFEIAADFNVTLTW